MKRESSANVVEKIERLRNARNWSINRLAKEAGMAVSTLNNLYLRASVPSVGTLEMICGAFHITLSDFFKEESDFEEDLPEAHLARAFGTLSKKEQQAVLNLVDALSQN